MGRLNPQRVWRRGGVVHVRNTPPALTLFPQSSTAGNRNLLSLGDAQIIFHPDGVTDGVLSPRCDRHMSRRVVLEVALAKVGHAGVAAVVVSGTSEHHNGRRQAIGEGSLIGAVERGLAVEQFLMQFCNPRFGIPGFK